MDTHADWEQLPASREEEEEEGRQGGGYGFQTHPNTHVQEGDDERHSCGGGGGGGGGFLPSGAAEGPQESIAAAPFDADADDNMAIDLCNALDTQPDQAAVVSEAPEPPVEVTLVEGDAECDQAGAAACGAAYLAYSNVMLPGEQRGCGAAAAAGAVGGGVRLRDVAHYRLHGTVCHKGGTPHMGHYIAFACLPRAASSDTTSNTTSTALLQDGATAASHSINPVERDGGDSALRITSGPCRYPDTGGWSAAAAAQRRAAASSAGGAGGSEVDGVRVAVGAQPTDWQWWRYDDDQMCCMDAVRALHDQCRSGYLVFLVAHPGRTTA
jgi:hypothetical protein